MSNRRTLARTPSPKFFPSRKPGRVFSPNSTPLGQLSDLSQKLPRDVEFIFVGCGSSFYLALAAASTWATLTGGAARAVPASELLLFPRLYPN